MREVNENEMKMESGYSAKFDRFFVETTKVKTDHKMTFYFRTNDDVRIFATSLLELLGRYGKEVYAGELLN